MPRATLDGVDDELQRWRERAIPDVAAPLDADDVARLVRDCFATLGIDAAVAERFSVNTVHYYRRKDILDEPDGRTSAARYGVRHVWQAAGARLAGSLGLVTLAEARDTVRGASESTLKRFVAARIADVRGRSATRQSAVGEMSLSTYEVGRSSSAPRPLRATRGSTRTGALQAAIVPLGENAMCLIPNGHAALRSTAAARALVDALARALGVDD